MPQSRRHTEMKMDTDNRREEGRDLGAREERPDVCGCTFGLSFCEAKLGVASVQPCLCWAPTVWPMYDDGEQVLSSSST